MYITRRIRLLASLFVLSQSVRSRWVVGRGKEWHTSRVGQNYRKEFKSVLHSVTQGMNVLNIRQFKNKA
jgi:hypothetical protein